VTAVHPPRRPHADRPDEQAAFAVFRPRRGRTVALCVAVVTVVVFGVIALLLPTPADGRGWTAGDRFFFFSVGLAMAFVMWRFASIRAIPTRESLTVRNLFLSREVPWGSIVDVRFAGGDPWVTVELDDTDTLAVMAIQKADAEWGRSEASRLAALVQGLGPAAPSPDPSDP
jgi:Bacterial PH domain